MKKFILSITVMCYLLVSTGFIMSTHYCMNELSSVHFFEKESEVCGKCGMETHESNGCCRDEVKIVKLTQDQNKVQTVVFELANIQLPVFLSSAYLVLPFYITDEKKYFLNHLPPLLSKQYTYLQHNVFRI